MKKPKPSTAQLAPYVHAPPSGTSPTIENPDVPPHNADPEHEEEVVQPLQFPFTPAGMTGFRDAGPNLKNEEPNELKRKP